MEDRGIANSIFAGIVMITAENLIRKVFEYFSEEHDKKIRTIAKEETYKVYNEILEYQAKQIAAQQAQQVAAAAARADAAPSTRDDVEDAGACAEEAE